MKLEYLTLCHSQYFSGSSDPVVRVMVDNTTTIQQVKTELLSCQATEHLDEINDEEYKAAVENYFETLTLKPEELVDSTLDSIFDPKDDDEEYNEEYDCYIYFAIIDSGLEHYK